METFKENGSYNKTDWKIGDIITTERLNKIEAALYEINENSNDVNKLDLSNYVTKSEMPTNVSDFINDAGYVTRSHTHTNYATKAELNDAIANIEPENIDLTNYATKAELNNKANLIHSHDQYLTEHQDLSSYATKTYVDNAISNVDVDLTNYATKTFVTNKIAEAQLSGVEGEVDLSGFATKDDIPTDYVSSNNITRIEVVTEYPSYENPGVLYIKVSE